LTGKDALESIKAKSIHNSAIQASEHMSHTQVSEIRSLSKVQESVSYRQRETQNENEALQNIPL
jgi:hypothetical protein